MTTRRERLTTNASSIRNSICDLIKIDIINSSAYEMIDDDWPKKLRHVEQELQKRFAKRRQLIEAHESHYEAYKTQKTIFQRFFGQPPFAQDLVGLDSIDAEIADFQEQRRIYADILSSARRPVPEQDWLNHPFYSHNLKSWNFNYPADQLGLYLASLTGIGIVSKAIWRSWHIKRAAQVIQDSSADPGLVSFHRYFSRLNNDQLKDVARMRRHVTLRALGTAGLLIGAFAAFVQLKNTRRTN